MKNHISVGNVELIHGHGFTSKVFSGVAAEAGRKDPFIFFFRFFSNLEGFLHPLALSRCQASELYRCAAQVESIRERPKHLWPDNSKRELEESLIYSGIRGTYTCIICEATPVDAELYFIGKINPLETLNPRECIREMEYRCILFCVCVWITIGKSLRDGWIVRQAKRSGILQRNSTR